MNGTNIIDRAREFAEKAHSGQVRKFGVDRPYIYHPEQVYRHLAFRLPDKQELLAAAWLHDVIEDCGVSVGDLDNLFGSRIATLVWEVSHLETPPGTSRKDRWPIYLEHFALASEDGKILKLADRYCNICEYVDFADLIPKKEWKFIRGVYRNETMELVNRIGDADKETAIQIIDTMDTSLCKIFLEK